MPDKVLVIEVDTSVLAIRCRIAALRLIYGDCLNLWPKNYQDEYHQLDRQLRQLEVKKLNDQRNRSHFAG